MKSKFEKEDIVKIKAEFLEKYPKQVRFFRRENLGWTVTKMAKVLGVSRGSLSSKEHGHWPFTAFESYIFEELRKEWNKSLKNKNGKSK